VINDFPEKISVKLHVPPDFRKC